MVPFLSHFKIFSCTLSLEISVQLFSFPFLSLSFCSFSIWSYDANAVAVISLYFFSFDVVLESFYWCILAILNAGESSSSFLIHIVCLCKAFCIAIIFFFFCPWVHLSEFLFWLVLSIFQWGQPRRLFVWWNFCYRAWYREAFSFFWDPLFLFLFYLHLFDSIRFQYSLVFKIFLPSNILIISRFSSSIPSVVSFLLFVIIGMAHFSGSSFLFVVPCWSRYMASDGWGGSLEQVACVLETQR